MSKVRTLMRVRPTYANIVSTLALFIALGGTSYAVASLPKNSVGDKQLKKNAVTGDKVKDGSLTSSDLSPGAIASGPRGPRGADGAPGPSGPTGATGATGATGPAGQSEVISISRPNEVAINLAYNSVTPLASLNLNPGSWSLDAQVRIDNENSPLWFDCDLQPSTGSRLVRSTAMIGGDTTASTLPLVAAVNLPVATQITLQCGHLAASGGPTKASNVVLRATRVSSIEHR